MLVSSVRPTAGAHEQPTSVKREAAFWILDAGCSLMLLLLLAALRALPTSIQSITFSLFIHVGCS
jgi:hypothetical protein